MAGTISDSMKSAVEARLEEVYEELGYRPRMSKCSDEGCYSDISSDNSEADLMKESRRSVTSAAEATDRSTFTGSLARDGEHLRESFYSTASRSDAPAGDYKRRFGRISDTFSSAETARSTWNNLFTSTGVGDTDDDISHFSFPDCEDYMDLFDDEPVQYSTGLNVVAGAGSIMKSRQSDGSLPDNPARQHGEHGRGSSLPVQQGGPSSSWEGSWTDSVLQGTPTRQPRGGGPSSQDAQRPNPTPQGMPPSAAWTRPCSTGTLPPLWTRPCSTGTPPPSSPVTAEEAGGAVSDASFAAKSYVGWLTTSSNATPRTTGSDCATATGAPLGEVVSSASWRAAAPSAGMGTPRSLPPLPPAESSAKSGAYIRRRRPS